jgi:predicted enzyme related to lactoylglutathione lyase
VADLQAALDKAQKLGGKTAMPPMDVPGGPSIAQFTDPAGNLVGLVKEM